ncbi:hypothetical protein FOA52_009796 [Chlamydomonas sp. UWO 241]|nr:hypothetical protein FOA52_009796 [Chlamydomonas sp. UWO 241]
MLRHLGAVGRDASRLAPGIYKHLGSGAALALQASSTDAAWGRTPCFFSSASAASAAQPASDDAPSSSSGGRGSSGRSGSSGRGRGGRGSPPAPPTGRVVTTAAPWPFIDPSRPMIMPVYISPTNTRAQPELLPLEEALAQVKANAATRAAGTDDRDKLSGRLRCKSVFDETVEFSARLGVNPRKADQIVRGACVLPHGTGRRVSICVFAKGADADIARAEGADVIGDDDLIASIIETGGKSVLFDKLIATPEFMKPLARAGKVLGPKGLMPNVKLGTLTSNVAFAIREMRRGRLDFRVDRDGNMHAALGKVSFSQAALADNIAAFVSSLLSNRPKSVRGSGVDGYLISACVKSTMTKAVRLAIAPLADAAAASSAAAAAIAAAAAAEVGAAGGQAEPAAGSSAPS